MREVEEQFEHFIESVDGEKSFDTYFAAIRQAYIAGYNAALNKKHQTGGNILQLICTDSKGNVISRA